MNDSIAALIVLALTFGGTLLGMRLARMLPEHHLSDGSRDTVKVAMGLTASIAALVLGLVTASAKSDFDDDDDDVRRSAADFLILDRTLANYGPETAPVRELVKRHVAARLAASWPEAGRPVVREDGMEASMRLEKIVEGIGALTPDTEVRKRLQGEALQLGNDAVRTHWHVLECAGSTIPPAFLVILVAWLVLIFTSFGLLAPSNATTLGVTFVAAASVSAAIFLILEMAEPIGGVIEVSPAPLRYALAHIGK